MCPSAETGSISVLYIEDDARLAALTARYLESQGVRVELAGDAAEGIAKVVHERPDAILLDLMLPGADGFDLCRRLRERVDTPILMVTARGEEIDRVVGLECGADDYVSKPFSPRELLARVRAHVRRARGMTGPTTTPITVGRLLVDPSAMRATIDGEQIALTTYEFQLLHALAERVGRVLTREQLLDLVRGTAEESFDRSIDVHVSRLRHKLGDDPRNPRLLKTVRGIGYMLAAEPG